MLLQLTPATKFLSADKQIALQHSCHEFLARLHPSSTSGGVVEAVKILLSLITLRIAEFSRAMHFGVCSVQKLGGASTPTYLG